MLGLGPWELLIILLIVIAVFGASRLAGIGSALGTSVKEFKNAVKDDEKPEIKPVDPSEKSA